MLIAINVITNIGFMEIFVFLIKYLLILSTVNMKKNKYFSSFVTL